MNALKRPSLLILLCLLPLWDGAALAQYSSGAVPSTGGMGGANLGGFSGGSRGGFAPVTSGATRFQGSTPSITTPSSGGQRLAQPRNVMRSGGYNIKAGPVQMSFDAGMGVEYNSNVNVSEEDPRGSLVLTPRVGMNLYWPITRLNNVSLALGLGYNYYLDDPDLGGQYLLISPATELMFNIFIQDFIITIYERPSVTENPTENPTVSNAVNYTFFNNTAGIDVLWDLNDLQFGIGYANQIRYSLNDDYTNQDTISNQIYVNASAMVQPFLRVGVEGNVYNTYYFEERPFRTGGGTGTVTENTSNLNNSVGSSAGLFAMGNISRFTSWSAGVGWQITQFNETNNPLNTGNASNPYFYFGVSNELNRFFTHSFSASFQTEPSYESNFLQAFNVGYSFNWILIRNWSLGGGVFYQNGTESPGPESEDFNRVGANVGLGYELTKNLVASLYYSVISKGSTVLADGYNQQIFGLNLNYNF
jgi:hypothetical protein